MGYEWAEREIVEISRRYRMRPWWQRQRRFSADRPEIPVVKLQRDKIASSYRRRKIVRDQAIARVAPLPLEHLFSQIIRFSLFANTRLASLCERIDSDRTITMKIATTSILRLPKDPICDIALRFENAPIFLSQDESGYSRRGMISDGTRQFRGINLKQILLPNM